MHWSATSTIYLNTSQVNILLITNNTITLTEQIHKHRSDSYPDIFTFHNSNLLRG